MCHSVCKSTQQEAGAGRQMWATCPLNFIRSLSLYSIFLSFYPAFFLTPVTGFWFYVITSAVKNHWSFPNVCFSLYRDLIRVLLHAHAAPTHSKSFCRSRTTCESFNIGTVLKIESSLAPSMWRIFCVPVELIHLGCKWQVGKKHAHEITGPACCCVQLLMFTVSNPERSELYFLSFICFMCL